MNGPIKKISTADLVFDRLKQNILSGNWIPGQKIPAEIELADTLAVNRLTVRIALQRLSALGLLDIRVGDGTYVKEFDLSVLLNELSDFYIKEKTLSDVSEYRLALELACAEPATERRTEEELRQYYDLCCQFRQELEQYYLLRTVSPDEAHEFFIKTVNSALEMQFLIAKMTHNDLMIYSFALMKEPMKRHMLHNAAQRLEDYDADQSNRWIKVWFGLHQALMERDVNKCKDLLEIAISR